MKNKDALEILFIRHAQTNYDDWEGRDPCDGELTARGEEQCNELGERLKDVEIDAFITSSLLRSFKTATGVCKAKANMPLLEICPELMECGCTKGYYGSSEEVLKKYYPNTAMCEKLYGTKEYEFESFSVEKDKQRAAIVIDYIKNRFGFGERVAVFSHHGFLEHLIPTALGIEPHKFFFALDNVSVTVVCINNEGKAILRSVNSHDLKFLSA